MAQNNPPSNCSPLVQAVYSFNGKNNDELCFKKGDVITVTQREDGGWWEGTLAGLTGWFPSNYVKEHKAHGIVIDPGKTSPASNGVDTLGQQNSQQHVYRSLVIKDIVDSEKAHVAELKTLVSNFLQPLQMSDILTKEEYRQLVGNMEVIIEVHSALLAGLESMSAAVPFEQRIGRVFLQSAPRLKTALISYCTSHPRAVCILNKHKDALNLFMEGQGAASPGLLVLTTGLSKPFRRLEKYTGMLQELERHMEESHVDRGDTQRSVPVYKDIWSSCSTTRRQKEQELEVLTGGVRGWEGEELSSLGEILHMGSVAVGPDHRDRYMVLFPGTLLILSVSARMSGFIYEGKLPLCGITVSTIPDSETCINAFEITGSLIDRIMAVCQTREEQQGWVESLRAAIASVRQPEPVSTPVPKTVEVGSKRILGPWTVSCLKPLPPLRPKAQQVLATKTKVSLSPTKAADTNFEEDIQVLRVIEFFCNNSSVRNAMNPELQHASLIPGRVSNGRVRMSTSSASMASKERYVFENIELLRNQLCELSSKLSTLSARLDDEICTRTALQDTVYMFFKDVDRKLGNTVD